LSSLMKSVQHTVSPSLSINKRTNSRYHSIHTTDNVAFAVILHKLLSQVCVKTMARLTDICRATNHSQQSTCDAVIFQMVRFWPFHFTHYIFVCILCISQLPLTAGQINTSIVCNWQDNNDNFASFHILNRTVWWQLQRA